MMASSQDTLKMFLTFVTGAPCLPYFGLETLSVKFSDQPSIFASTCLCEITLPKMFVDQDHLKLSLEAVLQTCGKSFNCINFKTYYSTFFKCYSCSNMTSFCDLSAHTEMTSTVVTQRRLIPFEIYDLFENFTVHVSEAVNTTVLLFRITGPWGRIDYLRLFIN